MNDIVKLEPAKGKNAFKVNGKVVDVSACLPLKIRDWKALKKQYGIDAMTFGQGQIDLDTMLGLATYVIQKSNDKITLDEIEDLELESLIAILRPIIEGNDSADRPT